jgi:hypothetical protein
MTFEDGEGEGPIGLRRDAADDPFDARFQRHPGGGAATAVPCIRIPSTMALAKVKDVL